MSCEASINPKWKHAIDNNTCPCCGLFIMEEELKELLLSLGETINDLSKYQEQVDDWLLSNHNYIKTDSPNLVNYIPQDIMDQVKEDAKEAAMNAIKVIKNKDFAERKASGGKYTVKVETENGEQDVEVEKIQDEDTTNDFFKRAEAVKPNIDGFKDPADKTKKLKNLVQQIKKNGTGGMAGGGSAMSEYADPEAVAEMEGFISGGGEISSALSSDGGDDDAIPSIVLSMANKARGNGNTSEANARDLQKLEALQSRTASARSNSLSGKGAFSRS